MTVETLLAGPDETIPGLWVVGFHGRLGFDQTPTHCAPVFADDAVRLVRILEAKPNDDGSCEVRVEIGSRPISDYVWSTTGTRIDPPWPARLGEVIGVIGPRELELIESGSIRPPEQPGELDEFFRWVGTHTGRSDRLRCARVGEMIAWSTRAPVFDGLQAVIAEHVRTQVFTAARGRDMQRLISKSFWLSRAAVDDEDLLLAVAGLRQAGSRHWELVLDAGLPNATPESRRERLEVVAVRLRPQPTPSLLARTHLSKCLATLRDVGPHREERSAA